MAQIDETLTPRKFELIRDQIATILAAELPNQATLNGDNDINATVWLERLVPLSQQECPAVNVFCADGKFERFTTESQTGEYMFAIDVFTRGATEGSTAEQRGDLISTKKMMRIVGIIQAIFSHYRYCKLGFAGNFIDRVEIQSFKLMEPVKAHDNHNVSKGRLILMVKAEETLAPVEPTLIDGFDTAVKLFETEYGYLFSGESPGIVPQPTAPFPVGLERLLSGQTTSWGDGDDADRAIGRAVDRLTLFSNNPFGNNKRLTDLNGGDDYLDGIVVDWSQYNVITKRVLLYTKDLLPANNWDDQRIACNGLTVGPFSDGWGMMTDDQMHAIYAKSTLNFPGRFDSLNYDPFNINIGNYLWTSTSRDGSFAIGWLLNPFGSFGATLLNKGNNYQTLATRWATVNGTVIT